MIRILEAMDEIGLTFDNEELKTEVCYYLYLSLKKLKLHWESTCTVT